MSNGIGEIVTAITKAMGAVRKVGRGGENTNDNYKFAAIDDFLTMVNPICAEHGLMVDVTEDAIEDFTRKGKYGESAWMRVRYLVTVYHTSGQSMPPVHRTVEVLRNGAQAYGSAQSYVLKQFLRGLLLIATGDMDDADFERKDEGTVTRDSAPPPCKTTAHKDPALQAPSPEDQAIAWLRDAPDAEKLALRWAKLGEANPDVANDPSVEVAYRDRAAQFTTPSEGFDLGGDEIPF